MAESLSHPPLNGTVKFVMDNAKGVNDTKAHIALVGQEKAPACAADVVAQQWSERGVTTVTGPGPNRRSAPLINLPHRA